ncbi:hypothetical protein AB0E88_22430 [Streptomyces sp. NPDC028635]|uniref:hypothetical protein n=1 Tax=Streptomyces sp. NPDC028635 TaxID=3154800 RepID=UPI0033D3671B
MIRTRRRRRAPAAAVAAGLALLAGCGIRQTEAIGAGSPATVQAFLAPDTRMLIFFTSPDGSLSPVIRSTEPPARFGDEYQRSGTGQGSNQPKQPVTTEKVVVALLEGPSAQDRAVGLRTSLPPAGRGKAVTVNASPDGAVTVGLPLALGGLNRTALRQLICTIAYTRNTDGAVTVHLKGQDGAARSGTCGLDPATEATPEDSAAPTRTGTPITGRPSPS